MRSTRFMGKKVWEGQALAVGLIDLPDGMVERIQIDAPRS